MEKEGKRVALFAISLADKSEYFVAICLPSARVCVLWCLSFCLARSYVKGGHKKAGGTPGKGKQTRGPELSHIFPHVALINLLALSISRLSISTITSNVRHSMNAYSKP